MRMLLRRDCLIQQENLKKKTAILCSWALCAWGIAVIADIFQMEKTPQKNGVGASGTRMMPVLTSFALGAHRKPVAPMPDCKWMLDEVCVNADCPMCCDFCPVADTAGVCRFEERGDSDAPES